MSEKKIFSRLDFNPAEGWRDKDAFPDDYSSADEVRASMQKLFDQIKGYLNSTFLNELENAVTSEMNPVGAELIGASPLNSGDTSDDNVMAKLIKLREDIRVSTSSAVPDDAVSTIKIQDGAVTNAKLHATVQSAITSGGKCKQAGSSTFNTTVGRFVQLATNFANTNYVVVVTPSGNTNYTVGEIWVADKTISGFKVYCSGSNTASPFDYAVFVS